MARIPGSRGAHSSLGRQPSLHRGGTWTRNCARPPSSVPNAHPIAMWAGGKPIAQSMAAQAMVTRLNMAGERAGMAKRSSALSIPMATAAKESRGRKGSITRVRATVVSILPGTAPKPGARASTSGRATTTAITTSAPSTTPSSVSRREASWCARARPPSWSARA